MAGAIGGAVIGVAAGPGGVIGGAMLGGAVLGVERPAKTAYIRLYYHFTVIVVTLAIRAEVKRIYDNAVARVAPPGYKVIVIWAPLSFTQFGSLTWSYGHMGSGEFNVKIDDTLTLPIEGGTVGFNIQLNPTQLKSDSADLGVSFDLAVATTIAHEVGVHVIAGWWFHAWSDGCIDATRAKVASDFSTEAAQAFCAGLGMPARPMPAPARPNTQPV